MAEPLLQLLSWNIQWGRGVDGRVDLDRIVQVALHGAADGSVPDVLMLQEVADGFADLGGHDGTDQFTGLAQRLPGWTVLQAPATDIPGAGGRRQRFGNLLATRLPVGQVWRHLLPWPACADTASMQRVALEATLHTPLGALRATTTHLEYYAPPQRAAQVQRLRELHREAVQQAAVSRPGEAGAFASLPRAAPGVLCGDFNCQPSSVEWRALLAPFDDGTPRYVDAWTALHPQQAHAPTLGVHDHAQWPQGPMCFDAFFVTEDLVPRLRRCEVDVLTQASDHQPIRLWLSAA